MSRPAIEARRWSTGLLITLFAFTALFALGAKQDWDAEQIEARQFNRPAVQVISWDEGVALFDSVNGAVYRLRGSLSNPSVRNTWQLRVPPVTVPTSGVLELQRATFNAPGALFLVDVVTGQTWILRDRPSETGSWEPVLVEP